MVAVDNRGVGQGAPTKARLCRTGRQPRSAKPPGRRRAGHLSEVAGPSSVLWVRQARFFMISRMSAAVADGVLPTWTPAASRASFLAAAVPDEPDTMAPA